MGCGPWQPCSLTCLALPSFIFSPWTHFWALERFCREGPLFPSEDEKMTSTLQSFPESQGKSIIFQHPRVPLSVDQKLIRAVVSASPTSSSPSGAEQGGAQARLRPRVSPEHGCPRTGFLLPGLELLLEGLGPWAAPSGLAGGVETHHQGYYSSQPGQSTQSLHPRHPRLQATLPGGPFSPILGPPQESFLALYTAPRWVYGQAIQDGCSFALCSSLALLVPSLF